MPVIADASCESRNATAAAICSGCTMRPSADISFSTAGSRSLRAMASAIAGVSTYPGDTELTRTPERPHSTARFAVICSTAALAAP